MSTIDSLSADELLADEDWWRIYVDSFPASERESRNVIVKSITQGVGIALRARREEKTIGLATTHILMDPPAVFLVYLAVAGRERSRGTGGELMKRAWELGTAHLLARGLRPLGCVWEVDPPETQAADAEARLRRIAFFQRHGGQLLNCRYMQPPVNGTTAIPMTLMFMPASEGAPLTSEVVEGLVRAMYFEKYGKINEIAEEVLHGLLDWR